MSVHWRAAHPESYHSYKSEWDTMSTGKTNQRQSGKTTRARWSQEQTSALALYESRLVRRGCPTGRRNLNEELAQLISGRTSEAIKSHRRAESYRELVDRYEQMGTYQRYAKYRARRQRRPSQDESLGPAPPGIGKR